jgi:zinc protease
MWSVLFLTAAFSWPSPVSTRGDQSAASSASRPASAQDATAQLVTEFDVKGLKVLLKRREGSQTVAAGMFFRGGARNVSVENAGVESLALQVATEATTAFPRERLRRELASTGTSIGAGMTWDYSVLSLASTRQGFDRAWAIFSDAVLRPSFQPDDVNRVKARMVAALSESESTPDSQVERLLARAAYAGHPYQNDPRGSVDVLRRLTPEDLKQYHQQSLQTSRMLLVVVGDLTQAVLQPKVEAAFGGVPRGNYATPPAPVLSFTQPAVQVTARELPINFVKGVYAAPPLTSPDIYPLRVATSVLEQRVFDEVRVKRSLSYAPDAFLESQGANVGGIEFTSVDPNQTVTIMLGEIARLQTVETRPDEIRAIAQQFLTKSYLQDEASAAQAGTLAQYELIGGGWRQSAEALQRLRAVTPADVRRVANTYMRNLQFIVVGNPRSIDQKLFTQQR